MDNNTDPKLYSQQAEEAIIGAALIDPGLVRFIDLEPEEFYIQRNAWVWDAIKNLDSRGHSVDFVTLTETLDRRKQLAEIGGPAYIAGILAQTVTTIGVESYARIVRDYSHRRLVKRVATELARASYDLNASLDNATAAAMDALAMGIRAEGGAMHIREVLDELYTEIMERVENPTDTWGIPTGFIDFDQATGGLQPGEVYYLAGEPGIGKSKLAIQMGINMGAGGHPGVIFSLEMGRTQLVRRSLSAIAEIPTRNLKTGKIDDADWPKFTHACELASHYPIWIDDNSSLTTTQLRAQIARLKAQHGIEWAVVDYLLLMGDSDGYNETEISAKLSRRVKSIAKGLDMAMITVNSVTKDGMEDDQNKGKAPSQKQLRGSGQVIHDADIIGILKKHLPGKLEKYQDNLRTHVFVKGRELEGLGYFHLVAFPKWPSFGNYSPPRM